MTDSAIKAQLDRIEAMLAQLVGKVDPTPPDVSWEVIMRARQAAKAIAAGEKIRLYDPEKRRRRKKTVRADAVFGQFKTLQWFLPSANCLPWPGGACFQHRL